MPAFTQPGGALWAPEAGLTYLSLFEGKIVKKYFLNFDLYNFAIRTAKKRWVGGNVWRDVASRMLFGYKYRDVRSRKTLPLSQRAFWQETTKQEKIICASSARGTQASACGYRFKIDETYGYRKYKEELLKRANHQSPLA